MDGIFRSTSQDERCGSRVSVGLSDWEPRPRPAPSGSCGHRHLRETTVWSGSAKASLKLCRLSACSPPFSAPPKIPRSFCEHSKFEENSVLQPRAADALQTRAEAGSRTRRREECPISPVSAFARRSASDRRSHTPQHRQWSPPTTAAGQMRHSPSHRNRDLAA